MRPERGGPAQPQCPGRPRGGAGGTARAAPAPSPPGSSACGDRPPGILGLPGSLPRDPRPAGIAPPEPSACRDRSPGILTSGSRHCSPAACQRRASMRRAASAPLPAAAWSDPGWGSRCCPGGGDKGNGKLGVGRQLVSVHPLSSSLLGEVFPCVCICLRPGL